MSANSELIGVGGGTGDLGRQMAAQISNFADVIVYDIVPPDEDTFRNAVDPQKRANLAKIHPSSLDQMLKECAIIHWCAPSSELPMLRAKDDQLIILHDSVMNTSLAHAERIRGAAPGIAHCLMNTEKAVCVAADTLAVGETAGHFHGLGLNVEVLEIDEHDLRMAHSQASLAWGVLHDLPVLDKTPSRGLPPSGQETKNVLHSRAAAWTFTTLETIFQNPYLSDWQRDAAMKIIRDARERGFHKVIDWLKAA